VWGVKGIGLEARLSWRIWIPIHRRGETVRWTTRRIGGMGIRYITAKPDEEVMPAKSLLFGADFVRHAAVICEGPFDAMRLGPGAVATMGLTYTQDQVARMARWPVRVICFDNTPTAQRQADKLAKALSVFPGTTTKIVAETGEDVAEADEDEVKTIRETFLKA
jgi:DNA primase